MSGEWMANNSLNLIHLDIITIGTVNHSNSLVNVKRLGYVGSFIFVYYSNLMFQFFKKFKYEVIF